MKKNKLIILALCIFIIINLTGCVNQSGNDNGVSVNTENAKIAVTSTAVMEICNRMDIDLIGVPQSSIVEIPERYKNAEIIGSPMSPDMEKLAQINPDWVLSPVTLMSDLRPKYDAAKLNYGFVNLKSIDGMYKSIEDIGKLFHKEDKADVLIKEYKDYIDDYKERHKDKANIKVLILMGLPGSYVVATKNSYVGSLIEMTGAENIYDDDTQEFLNVNTEDMLKKNPDIILRTAHAMPEDVMNMFKEEFETNDVWKHFDAVKNGRVYDLPHEYFGMSATFDYQKGLEFLDDILYQ